MHVRFTGLLLLVFILSSVLPAYGFDVWSSGGSMSIPGPWRYWFVVLDDSSDVVDVESLMALSRDVQEPVVRVIESLGGRVIHRHWVVNAVSFEASPDVALRIASLGYTVIPSLTLEPQMVRARTQGGVEPLDPIGVDTIGARRLHTLGITGAGVRVAVVDTGVENLHPWLMRGGRSVVAWEVDATGTGVVDYCGKRIGFHEGGFHGTHVAGIIAGQHPRTPGVAPGAMIYDVIVFREEAYCWWAYTHDIVRGVELALLGPDGSPNTGDEADVINLSLGSLWPPWWVVDVRSGRVVEPLVRALERAIGMGKVVVVAAGNAAGHMTVNTLCAAQGVICVGSSNQLGTSNRGDDRISWFSSRGPLPWFDVGPTVVAPGERIYSTIPTDLASQLRLPEPALEASGTSMAAPHVSGAVALLLEHYRRLGRVLTVDMAVRLLVHSSTTIRTTHGLDLAGAHEAGAGLIDVYNAAFAELLVDVNGSYMVTVVALGDRVNLRLTAYNAGASPVTADVRVWLDDSFRPPREGYEHVVAISPSSITIPPGGRAEATITIDVGKLPPGLYGGYIDLVTSGRSYRAAVSLVVPAKLERVELTARSEVELLIGRYSGPGWTPFEWVVAVFYIDKPLREFAGVRVEVEDVYAAPVAVKVFDVGAGRMVSAGHPGYILARQGLYVVLVELDILYWFLGFTLNGLWGRVVLEAPLFEETGLTLKSRLDDVQLQLALLSARVSNVESRVSDLELRLKGLESRLSSVEVTIQAIQSRLSDVELRVNTLSQELSAVKTQVELLARSLSDLSSRVSGLELYSRMLASNISRLELSLAKLESRVSSLEVELANNKAVLERLRGDLEALRGELLEVSRRLKQEIELARSELESLSRRLNETTVALKALIEAGEARTARALEEQAKRIEGLAGSVKLLSETLEASLRDVNKTVSLRLELLGARISEQATQLRMMEDRVKTLREDLEKTSRNLEEARRTLEDMIARETREAQETAARSTMIGLAALAIGLAAVATAGYTMLISRRAT
jgi:subtilisin family serine protease/predicted  nucleic acid-binding Zn-ribbon protein